MMSRKMEREDYAKLMSHFAFVVRRKYEQGKEYLIFAGAAVEAEKIAYELFGNSSFTVTQLTKTDNPLVYEI